MRRATVWVCVAGWSAVPLLAQDNGTPTLHVYTNLLQIPTLVIRQGQDPVIGIPESRFFVSLDGGPRFRVTHVRPEGDDPLSLAIVLDVSQPFPNLMRGMDDALAGLVPASLQRQDHVSIYSMDCHLIRSVDAAPADAMVLKRGVDLALEQWKLRGRRRWSSGCTKSVNLWDALEIVTDALNRRPGRRVILVVTDGVDRSSQTTWNELRKYAQSRGVAIFGLVQTGDTDFGLIARNREDLFTMVCNMTGGMVMTATEKSLADQLKQFTALLRERYIVEFPHPVDTKGGYHDMAITIDKSDALVFSTGIGVPVDDPAILKDPTTVPMDPASAPQMGKRRSLTPQ